MGGGAKYVEKEEVQIGDSDTCISISNDFFLFVSLTDNLNFVFFLSCPPLPYSMAILREITTTYYAEIPVFLLASFQWFTVYAFI